MWYDRVIMNLSENKVFTRKDIFAELRKGNSKLSYNACKWIIPQLVSEQLLYRIGYDSYVRKNSLEQIVYMPIYSEKAQSIMKKIEEQYPLAEFCIVEAFLLNEFINHQIANNTIIVQMEKEISGYLFDFLDEECEERILYKPNQDMMDRYWCEGCIVVVDKTSETPKDKENPHSIMLEKLLVDIFAEPVIRGLFSSSEYSLIIQTARERYFIDKNKMMRYARRRSAVSKIKIYME